jgi:hypothetical protein
MLGAKPFAEGCRGDGVTANGQNQTASVGGRVPTAGLTNGGANGSAVYAQLYLGLFSRPLRKELLILPAKKVHTVVAEMSPESSTQAIVGMGMYRSLSTKFASTTAPTRGSKFLGCPRH